MLQYIMLKLSSNVLILPASQMYKRSHFTREREVNVKILNSINCTWLKLPALYFKLGIGVYKLLCNIT